MCGYFCVEFIDFMLKGGKYVTNLDEYKLTGTHWIVLCMNGDNVTYFDSFGVENISKKNKKFIDNRNMIANIFRIHTQR